MNQNGNGSGAASQQLSPNVLRNRGVPVTVYLLDGDEPKFGPDGEPSTEERFVRFTVNVLTALETMYQGKSYWIAYTDGEGGIKTDQIIAIGPTAWQDAMRSQPFDTARTIFALMWNITGQRAGAMMMTDQMAEYAGALMASYAIAEGVDPSTAMAAVKEQLAAAVAVDSALSKSPPVKRAPRKRSS